jgi:predicted permease
MLQETARAFRRLMRAPRFTALCLLPMVLAFGGLGGLAGILKGLWLRSLDVHDPSRLVAVSAVDDRGRQGFISAAGIRALDEAQDVFESMAGYGGNGSGASLVELDGQLLRTAREVVTAEYFQVLGIKPLVGRFFTNQNDDDGVVISHQFWIRQLASDPGVIGRRLRVDGIELPIIGVTPPGNFAVQVQHAPEIILPLHVMPRLTRVKDSARSYYLLGRLRPNVTMRAAQQRLESLWPHVLEVTAAGATDNTTSLMQHLKWIHVTSARNGVSPLRNRYMQPLAVLLCLGGIVLVIACVNVGGLLSTRTIHRRGALSIELALGAPRASLVGGIFAEGLLLALAAAILSVPLAVWSGQLLRDVLWTGTLPLTMRLIPDTSVVLAMMGAAVLSAPAVSLPAIVLGLRHLRENDRHHARTIVIGTNRSARVLGVVQLALSLVLLFVGISFWNALSGLRSLDPGYSTEDFYSTRVAPVPGAQPPLDPASYFREMLDELSRLPGVESVALSHKFPVIAISDIPLTPVRGAGADRGQADLMTLVDFVSPEFFKMAGIQVVQGRGFAWSDDSTGAAVAIVNRSFARKLFRQEGASFGEQILVGVGNSAVLVRIVGIAQDASPGDVRISNLPSVYRPILQEPEYFTNPIVSVRGPGSGAEEHVRATIQRLGKHYPGAYTGIRQRIDQSMAMERLLFILSSFISGLALLLACLGLHSLLAYAIEHRLRELAVRMVLGASIATVRRIVLREGGVLVLVGLMLGVPLTLAVARVAGHLSPAISQVDRRALLIAVSLVLMSTGIAVAMPAVRLGRLNPVVVLRAE